MGGDFNIVCFPTKRLGVEAFTPAMHNFFDFISAHGLVDIPLAGDNFTWSCNPDIASMSRIDRFLYMTGWE